MRTLGTFLLLLLLASSSLVADSGRPILVTVDDLPLTGGNLHPDPAERLALTNSMLSALAAHDIRAVALVTWRQVRTDADRALLDRWLDAGHELGNHSYAHLSYSATETDTYRADIERARSALTAFLTERDLPSPRFFRFPMLREGNTRAKLDAMRSYLAGTGQRNLPVTLDNQDWSFNRPWVEAQQQRDRAEMARIAEVYHESIHLSIRHHSRTGERLFGRPVPEILLLHASAVSAAQWPRLFDWLLDQGFRFATTEEVLADPAFDEAHHYVGPRGPSLWDRLWSKRRHAAADEAVRDILDDQAEAWNRGDLEAFCAHYDEATLFLSSSGLTRGRDAVLARYQKRYPDASSRGQLGFEIHSVRPIAGGEISMLNDARPSDVHGVSVVARWTLQYPGDPARDDASGLTLLVFERRGGTWSIVRDASM